MQNLKIMKVEFFKFHGAGNDFIMIDNRHDIFPKNDTTLVNQLCHRRFGIGADGLILLENSVDQEEDFKMVYYNSDGNPSTMCGNGGRCIVAFAKSLKIINDQTVFGAIDGRHSAIVKGEVVSLKMQDVLAEDLNQRELFLDTGSPHRVLFSEKVGDINIKKEGSHIRYSEKYQNSGGTNVNFVQQINEDTFMVRTYERGVEDETYSCGTGVTAVAIAVHALHKTNSNNVKLNTPGGQLEVNFKRNQKGNYYDVWLKGPAKMVFKGEIEC